MTTSDAFDMSEFEDQIRLIDPGTTVFRLGRFSYIFPGRGPMMPGWKFTGIPGTNIGISTYEVTGHEDATTYRRLARLLRITV